MLLETLALLVMTAAVQAEGEVRPVVLPTFLQDTLDPGPRQAVADTPVVADTVESRARRLLADDGDLALRIRTRGQFGGDWTQFRPCDAGFQVTCNPGLIPQLQPDILMGVEAAGSIADRVFLDVDYDQTREFAGANRFQASYQGHEGELLQRVEVGDVTFALEETRFLTRGIPAGNFGILAQGGVGAAELQAVFAQQQGARRSREFRLGGVGGEVGIVDQDTLVVDDAGYVKGQFFFLSDPNAFMGAPHLDVLALRPGDAPASLAPGPEPIQLYRMERDPILRQQVEGFIQADAVAEENGVQVRESGWFRHLRPGVDYYLHPSGLWIMLRSPMRPDEALAVTYITAQGDTIGDYNPEAAANLGQVPTLELVRSTRPQHQPGRPTWDREMKQVYRVSGSDEVDLSSVEVNISLGEESGGRTFKETPDGRPIPLLRLFGLDETAPLDRVDRQFLFQPGADATNGRGVPGTFLVMPTLRPFMEPPPVPSEGLDAEGSRAVLGADANSRIYETVDPLEREASGLYRLNMDVQTRSAGVTASVALGSFGIREGSERIFLGDRLLRPEIDYILDHASGVLTLLQPEALLARSSSDRLQVSWEEVSAFRESPASVAGANLRLPVGDAGAINLMGLYQTEQELVNRPRFGAEPGAMGMVGLRSELAYQVPVLDAFLQSLPGERTGNPSELRFEGEMAVSLPEPNISGDAYLDDFDAGDERRVSLISTDWHLGSRPDFRDGAESALPAEMNAQSAASLVWQHNWVQEAPGGDSIGVFEGFLTQDEIDRQINFAGSQTREPGLRLTFGREEGPGSFDEPRWRSVTTLLSASGLDLTQTEFLDLYVAEGESATLIIDLGMVSEDAYFIDQDGNTSGLRLDTGRPWGLGELDQEADPLRGEVWGPGADARGVWPEDCRAEPGRVYPRGDRRANCTRGNGRRDTEDLNQNGVLDTTERYKRFVITLDGSSPYLARNRNQTGTSFRLYRIPLRGPGAINPGGQFTEADWRAVQFLRITATAPRPQVITLARMRLVGSRWVKRGVEGMLRGIAGDTLSGVGSMEVTPVSALSEGAAYQAPPGVLEQLDDPTSAVGGQGVEFNEKALALRYQGLGGGDRAEVYYRFLQRSRNFLNYSRLRLWAVAREGRWGPGTPTDFYLKVGSDPENFYLYRSRLTRAGNPQAVSPQDWLPEHHIEFGEWIELRRRAEEELLVDPPGPGDPPVEVWSADSTYAVVLRDRARAPNLAAVREISLGVWNQGQVPTDGELWINELRLGGGSRTPSSAQVVNMELDGGDLLQARLGYTGQGADFRQMDDPSPTFQSDGAVSLSGTLQGGQLLPGEWGVEMPVTVSHQRTARDPFFMEGTDLRGDLLPGLRTPGFSETRISMAAQARGETGVGWLDPVLPGADFRLSYQRSEATTVTSDAGVRGTELGLGYTWEPEERTVGLLPGILEPVARVLLPPSWLRSLQEARLQWTPRQVRTGNSLRQRERTTTRFNQIVMSGVLDPGFTEVTREAWMENLLRVELEPFSSLQGNLEFRSTRDVLDPEEGIRDLRVQPLVEAQQRNLLGRNLGWETQRMVQGRLTYRPPLPPWLRADLGLQTRYRSDRSSGLVEFTPDTLTGAEEGRLLRNTGAERDFRTSLTLDPGGLARSLADGEESPGGWSRLAQTVSPINVSLQDGITSWFYREPVRPGGRFQLGLGRQDRFESMDEVAATTLVDRRGVTAGSGLRLAGSFFANVNFQDTRTTSLDRRTERSTRTRAWPDLRVGVSQLPLPEDWEGWVERVSFSAGWQRVDDDQRFGQAVLQDRVRTDLRVPMELVVEWGAGFSTRYRGLLGRGDGQDPTGRTERARSEHGVTLETRLTPRGGLADRIQEPLRMSLDLSWAQAQECRVTATGDQCVLFVDRLDRGVNLAVDTRVSEVEVGGQLALNDRRSFTGLRTGSTQFQVAIWARLIFSAGPMGLLERGADPF